nr:PREDICTED: 17-beta-hydroxysteroid dehydrogenase 14 isoform X1 [Anolis carolinensis]|eukprot:XP_016852193.1 PREDICTED: 17-beta-hydroxysteroid dehydrogenase 14 isoform X1 [Anolis carolinensis]
MLESYALPYLRKTKGNIINLSSLLHIIGDKRSVPYVSSKGAISAMTKSLAIDESKYCVRVNSISAGRIWTPMQEWVANQQPDPEAAIRESKDYQKIGWMSETSGRTARGAEMATGLRYPGKVVIVTGGTRGIGEAIVREFAHQGAKVVFCAPEREEEQGKKIVQELEFCGGPGEVYFQICDVRCEKAIQNLVAVTIELYGRLDCLVNNAGIASRSKPIDNITTEEFQNVMDTNVVGCFLASKYALPYLRKTKGNIINIASLLHITGAKHTVPYVSSKGAISAMTKSLAIDESKYCVRVNSISPGMIWTQLQEWVLNQQPDPEAAIQESKEYQLLGRMGTPAEIAKVALFLAADATFCTGLDLVASGGAELGFGRKSQVASGCGSKN